MITGMAFGCTSATSAFGALVRKAKAIPQPRTNKPQGFSLSQIAHRTLAPLPRRGPGYGEGS